MTKDNWLNPLTPLSKVYAEQIASQSEVNEAKVDAGKSPDEKATARNQRNNPKKGDKGFGKFATSVFITRKDGESLATGKDSAASRKRREAHAKRRGKPLKKELEDLRKGIEGKPSGIRAADKVKAVGEGFSSWRTDLIEIADDIPMTDKESERKIVEKKVDNKVIINPKMSEEVEVSEVDMTGIEDAVEYFYEEGINEDGVDIIIEELGLEGLLEFIDGEVQELNEARDARRASVRAKSYADVKADVDKKDAAKKAAKKGEYAPSYAKKETDVTVYDDKPVAKKAPVKKVAKKDFDGDGKKESPRAEYKGSRDKAIKKAVMKAKIHQPAKKVSKDGIRGKVTAAVKSAYKSGVKRHKKAVQPARVFAKGVKAGAKSAIKFAGKAKKAVVGEEVVKESGWHRRNPDKVGTPEDPDYDVLRGKGKPVKASKPATTGKASKKPPGIYKPNKEGKFVKVEEVELGEDSEEKKRELVRKHSQAALKDPKSYKKDFPKVERDYVTKIQAEKQRREAGRRGRHDERVPTKEETTFDFVKRFMKEADDEAYKTTVKNLKKEFGDTGVLASKQDFEDHKKREKAKKASTAKQIQKKDERTAAQREVDAQYGGEENRKKGYGLGT